VLDLLALVLTAEAGEGEAGVLEEELLDLLLGEAHVGDGGGVLGAEGEQRPAAAQEVVAARLGHRAGDGQEHTDGGIAEMILDVVRAFATERGHRARVG
jgi:hypothetical protein